MYSFDDMERRIRRRYPTIHLRWNNQRLALEVWENHKGKAGNGWRHLWTYQNDDGTRAPVVYDTLLGWLLKADTRNWPGRFDLYQEIMDSRERVQKDSEAKTREALHTAIVEDYEYIAGVKTFFMDPSSMPQRVTTRLPRQAEILKKMGEIGDVPT
jgi:hypothetical protein